jgi:nucleoside-diphosphate-sugar epimerase
LQKLKPSADSHPVLLTGATGFIGQYLQRQLIVDGFRLRVVIRPGSTSRQAVNPACEVVAADLTDQSALRRAVGGVRAVVYCAGTVRGRRYEDFVAANVLGVQRVLEALRESRGSAPFLLISSLAAGRPELSHYARSKFAGEQVLENYPDLCWSVLRPPAVYGPGDVEMQPLLNLVRRGVTLRPGPLGQRLSLIHASDLACAVSAWLSAPAACRHLKCAIDDGHPCGYSWSEIGEAVGQRRVRQLPVPMALLRLAGAANVFMAGLFGYSPMLTPGKARELQQEHWLCDNSVFSSRTGWRPEIDLQAGARELFAQS